MFCADVVHMVGAWERRSAITSSMRVQADDLPAVVDVATRAFAFDPAFLWAFPNERTHMRKLRAVFKHFSGPQFRLESCDMTTTTSYDGLCTWLGPHQWDVPARKTIGPALKVLFAVGPRATIRVARVMALMKKHHPKEPHWYLSTLATDPPKQRQGVGRSLIAPGLARCDEMGLPVYLETQKIENVAYYQSMGFDVMEEVDIPKGGPHLWLMWREPR